MKHQTLKTLKTNVDGLLKEHPEWKDLPLIYSGDDEGNDYHKVFMDLSATRVVDINQNYLELDWFFTEDRYTKAEEVNCICIN